MSDFHLVDCANCGKQTMVDLKRPEDTCLFCGKNARKKEVIMQDNKERPPVPPKPQIRKKVKAYWEKHKEEILADYKSMLLRPFFERWHMATTTWMQLKKKWGIPNKSKGAGGKPGVKPTQKAEYKEPKPKPGEFCLLITEEDLAKLEDDDFRLIWVVLGRIIKNRLK